MHFVVHKVSQRSLSYVQYSADIWWTHHLITGSISTCCKDSIKTKANFKKLGPPESIQMAFLGKLLIEV